MYLFSLAGMGTAPPDVLGTKSATFWATGTGALADSPT